MASTIIIVTLLLSAFFSGMEIAFFTANRFTIELHRKRGSHRAAILAKLYENPSRFIGTMLVGNNIVLVVYSLFMEQSLRAQGDIYLPSNIMQNEVLVQIMLVLSSTIVVLIFGEFIPKNLFRLVANRVLFLFAYPLNFVRVVLSPFSWVMISLSHFLLKVLFNFQIKSDVPVFTKLDLENFVKSTKPDQHEDINAELFQNALYLNEVKVRDCMIPRNEIESIDVTASIAMLRELFVETKLSRILVHEGNIDNVLGYVHHQQILAKPVSIRSLIIKMPEVPGVTPTYELLNEFTRTRTSIARVFDEYGSTYGIVTMEDILEEIFGEIEDEHDDEDHGKQLDENTWVIPGRMEIDEINNRFDLDLPEGDYKTLSGYLVNFLDSIPHVGYECMVDDFEFIVEAVSDTRVERVRMIRKIAREDKN
jgi:putative hemolysin